jgi:hypothetical protein
VKEKGKRPRAANGSDPFLGWLHGLYLGQPSDRQRWLAWVAMVGLMTQAKKPERHRWHRSFSRLAEIEANKAMSHEERGQAFMDLLKEARPVLPRRGRRTGNHDGLLADSAEITQELAPAWPKGREARLAAVNAITRRIEGLELDGGTRATIVETCQSPRVAATTLLAYAYEKEPKTVEQALRRALKRSSQ